MYSRMKLGLNYSTIVSVCTRSKSGGDAYFASAVMIENTAPFSSFLGISDHVNSTKAVAIYLFFGMGKLAFLNIDRNLETLSIRIRLEDTANNIWTKTYDVRILTPNPSKAACLYLKSELSTIRNQDPMKPKFIIEFYKHESCN
jgi:hypothetical protein